MATQPLETTPDTPVDEPRDFESEARQHGWTSEDEFRGDKSRWVDAETFVKRADEVMPLLKKKVGHLERELSDIRKNARRMEAHYTKAEERIRAELVSKMEEAVDAGDKTEFRRLQSEHEQLGKSPDGDYQLAGEDPHEVFRDFRKENPWFDRGVLASATPAERDARIMYKQLEDYYVGQGKDRQMAPSAFFSMIREEIENALPALKDKAIRTKPLSDVAGVTTSRARQGGKNFNDLPPEAQKVCDKWVKQGLIKDRATYVASYDWN